MKTIILSELGPSQRYQYVLGAVAPRPIALVSSLDKDSRLNLAPYSFFNVFSATPPVLIFSANIRRGNIPEKDSLANIRETGEAVVNLVNYNMARQMALTGLEYPKGVNEFEKSGLTPIPSERVQPPRVKESPVQFECKLLEIKSLGNSPGAANLIIMEALVMHIASSGLLPNNKVNSAGLGLVGRLGGFGYSRVEESSVFDIPLPDTGLPVGFNSLPNFIKRSKLLTGDELAQLASETAIPESISLDEFAASDYYSDILRTIESLSPELRQEYFHREIRNLIAQKRLQKAWKLILTFDPVQLRQD